MASVVAGTTTSQVVFARCDAPSELREACATLVSEAVAAHKASVGSGRGSGACV